MREINSYGLNLYTKTENKEGKEVFKPVFWRDIKIRGFTIEEILEILDLLDLERIYGMKLTMKNLKEWQKILNSELNNITKKTINTVLKEIGGETNET